jgi:hypothetical protein
MRELSFVHNKAAITSFFITESWKHNGDDVWWALCNYGDGGFFSIYRGLIYNEFSLFHLGFLVNQHDVVVLTGKENEIKNPNIFFNLQFAHLSSSLISPH